MLLQNPYEKMKHDRIYTAPKEELTLMLYDGALKFVNQAILAFESKDYVLINTLVLKTQDIIRELQLTLNNNFLISLEFATIYDYIYRLLVEANVEKNISKLQQARDLIRDFRDMWKEAMTLSRSEKT